MKYYLRLKPIFSLTVLIFLFLIVLQVAIIGATTLQHEEFDSLAKCIQSSSRGH